MKLNRAPLEEAERRGREMGKVLKPMIPKGWAMVLFLTSIHGDEGGHATCHATLAHSILPDFLREMADRIEKGTNEQ